MCFRFDISFLIIISNIFLENRRLYTKYRSVYKKASKSMSFLRGCVVHYIPVCIAMLIAAMIATFIHERYGQVPLSIYFLLVFIIFLAFIRRSKEITEAPWAVNGQLVPMVAASLKIVTDSIIGFRIFFAIVGILSLSVRRPYFNSLMLLSLGKLSVTLQNVLKAVTIPRVALALSAMLGLIMIFIFTIFGFYFFPDSFYNYDQNIDECATLLTCLITFLHGGLLSGGGIADIIQPVVYSYSKYASLTLSYL